MNSSMKSALGAVSYAFMTTAVDSEMLLVTAGGGGGSGGASSLKDYCAGVVAPPQEGMEVEADWKNYGEHYPGEVRDVNKDGTYDIHYDDGFVEKRVKGKNVRPADGEDEKKLPPKDDPACEIVDALEKIKAQIKKSFADISAWLAGQRAKRAGRSTEKVVPPPRAEVSAAPGPAAAPEPVVKSDDPEKNTELANLKAELAAADEEVRQLEDDVASNDATIRSALDADSDHDPNVKTIDDLIEEYRSLIARRKEWIVFLKEKKTKQEKQLTGLGYSSVSLGDIDQSVQDILNDLADVTGIRDKLAKQDKLDPELETAIESILKQSGKLDDKVTALVNADKKAKEKKRIAAEKRESGGKDHKEHEGEEEEEAADDDVLKAAEDVEKELQEVDAGAKKLDGGVHPHGAKWWRYRYEHSFVEAILMIMIVFLIILWERLYHWFRSEAYKRSDFDAYSWMTHSTMHISWLEYFAGELMVCLLVFLTVWLLGKLGMLDYLVLYMPENKEMHLPTRGSEYEHLAIDVCVVLFWAIVFYFGLSLSIVHAATKKLAEWAEMEGSEGETTGPAQRFTMIGGSASEYAALKTYFTAHVHSRPHLQQEIWGDTEQAQSQDFPLWSYMRAIIREGTEPFFAFGFVPWCMIIVTFVVFMFLHYFLHMGYIRIMAFFLGLLVFQMLAVVWFISGINKKLHDPDNVQKLPADSIHNRYNTEKIVAMSCFYNVFILCYGIARVVCQPWMWELHFWVVLNLTIVAIVLAIVFCVFIAPLFPVFLVAMALPPYLDPENIAMMKTVVKNTGVPGDISDRKSYVSRVKGL